MDFLNDERSKGLQLTDDSKAHLSAIAQWTNINAITGLFSLMLNIITTIVAINKTTGAYAGKSTGSQVFTLVVTLTISLLLNITLLGAAKNLREGLNATEQGFFGIGIKKLSVYFRILGIVMIVVLVIVLLFFFIAIMAKSTSRF